MKSVDHAISRLPNILGMTAPVQGRVIVILGMHRSGTSVITRGLEVLGVELGNNLHPAGHDNPTGFWEDKECLEINNELLSHLNSSYDSLSDTSNKLFRDSAVDSLSLRAVNLVCRKLSEHNGLWGFKDPRTCRTLNFWKNVFNIVNCKTSFVIVVRNPVSVASSLEVRNKTPREKSYFLWLQHNISAILGTCGSPRVVVDYDRFLESPLFQLQRISRVLDLQSPDLNDDRVSGYLEKFVNKRLRHGVFPANSISTDEKGSKHVLKIFNLMQEISQDKSSLDSEKVVNEFQLISDQLDSFDPIFSYTSSLESQQRQLYVDLDIQNDQLNSLNQEIARINQEWLIARNEIANREGQINELTQAATKREDQLNSLNEQVRKLISQLAARGAVIASMGADLDELRISLATFEKLLLERGANISTLSYEIANREGQINELTQAATKREDQLNSLNQEIARINQEWLIARTMINAKDIELLTKDTHIANLYKEVVEKNNIIQDILNSNSWTITKPVRFLSSRLKMISSVYKK